MCNFLSAIYLRTGKLICQPQYTDSHSELIEANGIKERDTTAPAQHFVKLELTPPSYEEAEFFALDKWLEIVDEKESPAWFDAAARYDAFAQMRECIEAAKQRGEEGGLAFGGLVVAKRDIITNGSRVMAYSGSHVEAWAGSKVDAYDGSRVTAYDGSLVMAYAGSNVTAYAGSHVEAYAGSNVTAWDGSRVTARVGSKVTDV